MSPAARFRLRDEAAADRGAVRRLIDGAFAGAVHASGTEGAIVDALRADGRLSVALVAEAGGEVVGHAAFSPVTIDAADAGWLGLGPVAVRPDQQGRGVGSALIHAGLDRLRAMGAGGCVVLGDPGYYSRFGFRHDPGLRFAEAPPEYFMALAFRPPAPAGAVRYHEAFYAA